MFWFSSVTIKKNKIENKRLSYRVKRLQILLPKTTSNNIRDDKDDYVNNIKRK